MKNFAPHTRSRCAHRAGVCLALAIMVILFASTSFASTATHRSANFVVTASSPSIASQIAIVAEEHRRQFASEWLGIDLPDWDTPCRIIVEEQSTGGEGWISYETFRGRAENLKIRVTGQLDRIVEYVLPHEVAHATLAISIGRQVPRWADEGVALSCESESQQARQRKTVTQLTATGRIMPLPEILQLVDYPQDRRELIGYYAACFSLTEFLISRGGRQRLLSFVHDGDRHGWEKSVRRHYGENLAALESEWKSWRSHESNGHSIEVASTPSPTVTAEVVP